VRIRGRLAEGLPELTGFRATPQPRRAHGNRDTLDNLQVRRDDVGNGLGGRIYLPRC
jgi:hypothetical protein